MLCLAFAPAPFPRKPPTQHTVRCDVYHTTTLQGLTIVFLYSNGQYESHVPRKNEHWVGRWKRSENEHTRIIIHESLIGSDGKIWSWYLDTESESTRKIN